MAAERLAPADRPAPPGPAPLTWRRVLGLGLVLWLASVALLVTTEAVTLVPTVLLLGSFLVPVTAVVFYSAVGLLWVRHLWHRDTPPTPAAQARPQAHAQPVQAST